MYTQVFGTPSSNLTEPPFNTYPPGADVYTVFGMGVNIHYIPWGLEVTLIPSRISKGFNTVEDSRYTSVSFKWKERF